MVGRPDVEAAAGRIAGLVRRTPTIELEFEGRPVVLKLELLQHTGSFKPRGAFNRVLSEPVIPPAGIIAASGGNHGLAVAFVAEKLGLNAEIFVTEVTPAIKRDGIARLGAKVVVAGPLYHDALEASRRRAAETGGVEIHAYDHVATVAGQGTMARELDEQVPGLDTVLMAVGGGGFIGGAAAWFEGRTAVVAVEPVLSPALDRALAAGRPVDVEVAGVAADSLGAKSIGVVPFESIRAGVTSNLLVPDEEIRRAQRWLWDELRLVVEPGGATAMAALRSGAYRPEVGERLAVVVCGANTDPGSVTDRGSTGR